MVRNNEEVKADLVWRYVEHLRQADAEGRSAALSRAELEELIETLDTASHLPEALQVPESEQRHAAVRDQLRTALAGVRPEDPEPPGKPPSGSPRLSLLLPVWSLAGAGAAVAALVVALGTVNLWHHPQGQVREVVKRVSYPREAPDVQPINEEVAHRLIRSLVHNEISRQEERNLMWHMLVCPGCFEEYVQERKEHSPAQTASAPQTVPVRLTRW